MTQTQQETKIKFRPLGDRVLVKRLDAEEKQGGIILPDTAKKKQERAKVIAVGPGKEKEPMPVKIGDVVLMEKYSGQEVTIETQEFVILRGQDLIAVIEK